MKGKHLYYRCTSRVKSFPLSSVCNEKGINARVADQLVWQKITELMSSPDLLLKQAEYWLNNRNKGTKASTINIEDTEKEIAKLKDQEDRYVKAYGSSLITIEQLKEYTLPIKDKVSMLRNQITQAQSENKQTGNVPLPKPSDVEAFAKKSAEALPDLNFKAKQEIVKAIIDKVVGTKTELQVNGYIPVENINVLSINRNRWFAKRWEIDPF